MRRRSIPGIGFLAVLIPIALVLGIYLGGHPNTLPSFARNALVSDSDGRLYEEAIDTIQARLLPQDRSQAAAEHVAERRGRIAAGPVLTLLLAEGLRVIPT